MTFSVTLLVLVAALLHASWNAFVKAGNDKLLSIGLMHACSGVLGLCLLPFFPLPDSASWPYLALSAALHWGYYVFLINGYRYGDLGVVYPLARGSAPLLVAVTGALIAGERFPPLAMAGLAVASVGIVSLSFENGLPRKGALKPVFFALGTALWITAYTLADGLGVRKAGTELSYILWLFVLEAATFCPLVLAMRRTTWRTHYLTHWRGLWLWSGVCDSLWTSDLCDEHTSDGLGFSSTRDQCGHRRPHRSIFPKRAPPALSGDSGLDCRRRNRPDERIHVRKGLGIWIRPCGQ